MATLDELTSGIQAALQQCAEPARRDWWERYLKHEIEFRGVSMPDNRATLRELFGGPPYSDLSPAKRKQLARRLVSCDLGDDKLAGVLLYAEWLLNDLDDRDLENIGRLLDSGSVADWNTCDWLCVKVLGPWIEQEGEDRGRSIAVWRETESLWQRRAAVVAFVNLVGINDGEQAWRTPLVVKGCEALVRDPQRFAQTGVGWVMRELSDLDPGAVEWFVRDHADDLSTEATRMSIARLPDGTVRSMGLEPTKGRR